MALSLGYEDEQTALVESIQRFCSEHCTDEVVRRGEAPPELWRGLAELGVLALGTREGGGGALEIAAAMEALGAAACPGPLAPTFIAQQLLEEGARAEIAKGESLAAIGQAPFMAWAPRAEHFIELTGDGAWRVSPVGEIEAVETLGGEPWGRGEWRRNEALAPADRARDIANVSVAAYLVGGGEHLLEQAAGYAASREQFRRAIGEFQAVAHPLATARMRLAAAGTLTRIGAYEIDMQSPAAAVSAAKARLSASRAALEMAYCAHQTFGAMGFTLEGPVSHVSRRLRQMSLLPPGPQAARDLVVEAARAEHESKEPQR